MNIIIMLKRERKKKLCRAMELTGINLTNSNTL